MKSMVFVVLFFCGCAAGQTDQQSGVYATDPGDLMYDTDRGVEYMQGNCQHLAILAASIAASYGYEYEGVLGVRINHTSGKAEPHIHVRIFKDGRWWWTLVRSQLRVELWEGFGDWNDLNDIDFIPDESKPTLNLDEIAYRIQYDWWDAFRS